MKAFVLPALGLAVAGGIGLAALPVQTAQAQSSAWGYFVPESGPIQAGVQSPEGGQLILKCDEPGKGEVFAVIVSPEQLRPASNRPQVRPLWLKFDDGSRDEDGWRHYENSVTALNTRRDRTLVQFLRDLADASTLEVRLEPSDGNPVLLNFQVAGAREAIARVFESCEDENFIEES